MKNAITVSRFSKRFKAIRALEDIDLNIFAGEITGLVGPNGAGKSTLIKSIVGALQPSSGNIKVFDLDPIKRRWELRRRIGYMPQDSALYDDLSAGENVAFYANIHGIQNSRGQAEKLLAELDLGDRLHSPTYTLSGGMKKRVSLACAMVHDPELYLLDEPTAALDPVLKRNLWARFKKLAKSGKTLVISTHLMDEAMLCDRVVLLQLGKVVAFDTPQSLIARGNLTLHFVAGDRQWNETVPAEGAAVASALRNHGLSSDIDKLDINSENLEDVMVSLLNGGTNQ